MNFKQFSCLFFFASGFLVFCKSPKKRDHSLIEKIPQSIVDQRKNPVKIYNLERSKYKVFDLINILAIRNEGFNVRSKDEQIFYLDVNFDTVTIAYKFFFPGDDLEWLTNSDSVALVLKSVDRKLPDRMLYDPKMSIDMNKKEIYSSLIDSLFIQNLKESVSASAPYLITKLDLEKDRLLKQKTFIIEKGNSSIDTVEVIKNLGRYRIKSNIPENEKKYNGM